MNIINFTKNISEINKRKSLNKFGNINNISILDKISPFVFNKCTSESIEIKEEISTEEQEIYTPSFNFSNKNIITNKVDDNCYIPPVSKIKYESISIKISNYALDMKREELYKIITSHTQIRFGRFHMVMDRETGVSKGYTFLSVSNKEDSIKIINDLKVVVIDNLRLSVELAKN